MNLSIIIVSWNKKELLKKCLGSVFGMLSPSPQSSPIEGEEAQKDSPPPVGGVFDFKVFVVDNGSSDGTPEMIKAEFPRVKLIVNEKNLGFAKANNQVLNAECRMQNAEFVLFLNQDMEVLSGTLQGMVDFMRARPEAGVAGCHLIDANGKTVPQARCFPTVWDQAAILLKLPHPFPSILSRYLMKNFDYNKIEPREVDSLRGSFLMTRREVLEKIGGFDERFFFWFEEVDFCKRVKQAGWHVMYNGAVKCVDLVGQSVKELPPYKKQKMFTDSMLKYFKKWQPRWQYWLLWLLRPVGLGVAWIVEVINSKFIRQLAEQKAK